MAYKVIILYQLYMPSYFLGTFTEYPLLNGVKGLADVYTQLLQPEKELDWVFLSPSASLVPGQRTGIFRIGKDELLTDAKGESHISTEDFAVAMLNELEHPGHHREGFTVGY